MKIFYLLFFIELLNTSFAKCQTSSLDSAGYRLSVIFKTNDVIAAANVSSSELVSLANLFQNEENSLLSAFNANATNQQVQQLENQVIIQFQSILTPQELITYRKTRPQSIYAKVVQTSN